MCGRYTLTASELDLSWLGLKSVPTNPPSYNIAPGEQVLVVRSCPNQGVELTSMKWGLVPSWMDDFSRAQTNARLETAADKPMFREAFQSRRCLILADGWYDWQKCPDRSQPWYIRARQRGVLAFAGLWDRYVVDSNLSFDSCAILTTAAHPSLTPVSERMPVIPDKQSALGWLQGQVELGKSGASLFSGPFSSYPVGAMVNRVSNKQPVCVRPLQTTS